jgi:hypothetical protein
MGDPEGQEGESLAALKAILAKVAALLKPLQLNQEESIRLVEQLYGSVLEMDAKLAGEADDTRKTSILWHIQNTVVRREGDRIAVDFPSGEPGAKAEEETPAAPEAEAPVPAAQPPVEPRAKPAPKPRTKAPSPARTPARETPTEPAAAPAREDAPASAED